jgi:hypothetical protein
MTTDRIQNKHLERKARISDTSNYKKRFGTKKGLELTRMQSFVDGGHDIFDILEDHSANSQMKIKANKAANSIDEDLKETPLFQSILDRLRSQMKEMVQ